jgi:hypothetical protein
MSYQQERPASYAGSTRASDCELNAMRRLKQQSKMFATVLLSAFLPFYL